MNQTFQEVRQVKAGWMGRRTDGELLGPVATREELDKLLSFSNRIGAALAAIPSRKRRLRPCEQHHLTQSRKNTKVAIEMKERQWNEPASQLTYREQIEVIIKLLRLSVRANQRGDMDMAANKLDTAYDFLTEIRDERGIPR